MQTIVAGAGLSWVAADARGGGRVRSLLEARRAGRGAAVNGGESPGSAPGQPPGAFESLFREHEPDVQRLCRRLLGAEAGPDASQEVYLRGRQGFDSWDPTRPFRRWILAVAGNLCIDQLRRRSRETRIFDPSDVTADDLQGPGPSPLRQALHAEERQALLAAIDSLPQKYRAPLVLRYFQELDYDGIGDVLGLSRGQVGTLLFRAKRRLREALTTGGPT